jgi:peptidyl-prolyl cis-trans isomerase D
MNLLKTMRNATWLKYLMWVVVISFVAAIFFIWGRGGDSQRRRGATLLGDEYSVYVDGRSQSPNMLRWLYRQQEDQYRSMFRDQFNPSLLRGACTRLASNMADQLILEELAEKYGLVVSEREVADEIQLRFKFEDAKTEYPEMLSRMGISSQDFEDYVRRSLLLKKVRSLMQDTVYFTDKELLDLYTAQNEKFKASVANVPSNLFRPKVTPPTPEEMQAAYEKDKASFTVPEKRAMKYVFLEDRAIRKKVSVDEAQVRAFYDGHQAQFSLNANQRRASHILFKVAKDAKPAELEAAKKKAQEIYDRAKKGEDFAQLAKQNSQDTSASNGGDLGWFAREAMVPAFSAAVFDQCKAPGDIVGPIQSPFGFHVVLLTGLGGQPQPYEKVREQVKQALVSSDTGFSTQVKDLFDKAGEELKKAKSDGDFEKFAKTWDIPVMTLNEPFTDKSPLLNLGIDPKLMKAVFSSKKDEWSPALDFRKGLIRFCVTAVNPAHPASFEEAKAQIQNKLMEERAFAQAESVAKTLAAATGIDDLKKRAQAASLTVTDTGAIKLDDSIPGVGQDKAIAKALMASEVGKVTAPFRTKTGYMVAIVTEHTAVDPEKFAKEKDNFLKQQRSAEASRLIDDYVSNRRQELDAKKLIHVNEELVKSLEPKGKDERGG